MLLSMSPQTLHEHVVYRGIDSQHTAPSLWYAHDYGSFRSLVNSTSVPADATQTQLPPPGRTWRSSLVINEVLIPHGVLFAAPPVLGFDVSVS